MINEEYVKDEIYEKLVSSNLAEEITGSICRRGVRPKNSTKEDVVISVLANVMGQTQLVTVNVNIYVNDIYTNDQYEEDGQRLKVLCAEASKILEIIRFGSARGYLEEQTILKAGPQEHVINNKLLIKINNE